MTLDPSTISLLNQLLGASPQVILAVVLLLFVRDVIGPSDLRRAAEKRSETALAATSQLTQTLERNTAALAQLTQERESDREEFAREVAAMAREVARVTGALAALKDSDPRRAGPTG